MLRRNVQRNQKSSNEIIKSLEEMAKKLIQELKAKDDEIAELKKELE